MNPLAATIDRPANTRPDISPDIVDVVHMTIGQYLKKHRNHLTMKQVADAIGCDVSYLSKIENDHVVPPWDMVERLAHFYCIDSKTMPALAWKQLEVSKQGQLNLALAFLSLAS